MSLGIVVVSHVPEIAAGIQRLLGQVAGTFRLRLLVVRMTIKSEPA